MILSDHTIREELAKGRIVIDPLMEGGIQPSSVDLHVDRYFRLFRNHTRGVIDVKEDQQDLTELVEIDDDDALILHPGEFVLGSSLERVGLPNDLVGRLEGKSSLGRLGLLIHSSLPGGEPVVLLEGGETTCRPVEEVVRRRLPGPIVAFDPKTLEVGAYSITGWYEGPADRIFEVRLSRGDGVRVTAGHNLFTKGRSGEPEGVRTLELRPGTRVAVRPLGQRAGRPPSMIPGSVCWEPVAEVRDTGATEPVFDLEVRPSGCRIENFLAGTHGVFVSNTAGFVDAGFDGHLTLELSNVSNLPITVYPGMKIGQISFLRMTTAADHPYGSSEIGSKYQHQRGPTPSRYFENFRERDP